jgi:outer membrane immunogenic protein
MRKTASIAALAAVISAGAAQAADLPAYEQIPPMLSAQPVYDWTGFYVGANAGYSWGDLDVRDVLATNTDPGSFLLPVGTFAGPSQSNSFDGLIGGAQIGYNTQFGNVVAGFEADFQGSKQDAATSYLGSAIGPSYDTSADLSWFGTVRGRLGYAFDNVLIYGTGGLAVGRVKLKADTASLPPLPAQSASATEHETLTGFTLGAGTEIGIGNTGWSVKAEYLYVNFGKETVHMDFGDGLDSSFKVDLDMHIVRAGVNYRF